MRSTLAIVLRCGCAACALTVAPLPGLAQDSVAQTPGDSDAILQTGVQSVRYVVDLTPITGSWGGAYGVAPILKASADFDPMFPTHTAGALAVSSTETSAPVFASTGFSLWTSAGAGVNPAENSAPGSVSITGYDRQFALALSDFGAIATSVVSATVGQNAADLSRLYVTRTVALSSRATGAGLDTATLSLGAIDPGGRTAVRADDHALTSASRVLGENIAIVNSAARSASINALSAAGATDAPATTLVVTNGPVTLNTPTLLPTGLGGPLALLLDFASDYRAGAGAPVATHLNAAVDAHRGNPSFTPVAFLGGAGAVGTLGFLAVSDGSAAVADSIGVAEVNAAGAVVATRAATLPSPITTGSFSANAAGDAEFTHYLSQIGFRGGNGPAAVGQVGSVGLAAATASDPTQGEFIAVVEFPSIGSPLWSVAAHVGTSVLDGPGGTAIGAIAAASPATFSSPAMDALGNLYFVARVNPSFGSPSNWLIKAVRTGTGYQLERLLAEGDVLSGANSATPYTITSLALGDSDSVASGSVFSSSVLRPQAPGNATTDAASPFAFGGIAVNAQIEYDRNGTPEPYHVVLFIAPRANQAACEGDATGDGEVNFDDLNAVLSNWQTAGPVGDVAPFPGGDGSVDFADLNLVLSRWEASCN